jgi:hypothetical protein
MFSGDFTGYNGRYYEIFLPVSILIMKALFSSGSEVFNLRLLNSHEIYEQPDHRIIIYLQNAI